MVQKKNARSDKRIKICFASSSGGHYNQLMMLEPLMERYPSFILTERTGYQSQAQGRKTYYLQQVNRREAAFVPKMVANTFLSIKVFARERPDLVVCTGVLATIPMCLVAKAFRKKLIYIESFAKVTSATETGRLLYRFADEFYVQWEEMLKVYPNAIFKGGIY